MKVLISGGEKTQNIVDALHRKYENSGVDFIVVQYIDDIEEVFTRGEYIDRMLLIEQSWTHDFSNDNDRVVRQRINKFIEGINTRRVTGVQYIFLAQTEQMAELVSEEIIQIQDDSIILIKEPKYTVGFFASIITAEFNQLPDNIVYKPQIGLPQENIKQKTEPNTSDIVPTSLWQDNFSDAPNEEDRKLLSGLFDNSDFSSIEPEITDVTDVTDVIGVTDTPEISEFHDVPVEESTSSNLPEISEFQDNNNTSTNGYLDLNLMLGNIYTDNSINRGIANTYTKITDGVKNKDKVLPAENKRPVIDNAQLKASLDAIAARGNSMVLTGCGGCGVSTIAYNLANVIYHLGYTVLLVDMDTIGRTQHYISKDNYDSTDAHSNNLVEAFSTTTGIDAHVGIAREGFRILTIGIGSDVISLDRFLKDNRIARFVNMTRSNYNFVIYDIPFKDAVGVAGEITAMADNVVFVIDSSNWGITKSMLQLSNIESDDMEDIIFNKMQIVYNKFRGIKKVMGKRVKSIEDIAKVIDDKIFELSGLNTGYYFQSISVSGVIKYDESFENGWYNTEQYSDSPKGQQEFIKLLYNILLKE